MKHAMMKAAVAREYGPPEVIHIAQMPVPEPGRGEILLRVRAASVDSGDARMRAFAFPAFMKPFARVMLGWDRPKNPVFGTSVAGEVAALGEGAGEWKQGDRLMAMTGFGMGGHAQYILLKAGACLARMPQKATFEEAAALPFGGTTALYFLSKAGLTNGQQVLVYGASGAVGVMALQVAKAKGAAVDAFAGPRNLALMKELGAREAMDYHEIAGIRLPARYDIVFDCAGKGGKAQLKGALKPGGRFITVGGLASAGERREDLEALARLFDAGALRPVISRRFGFEDIVSAHRYVDSGRKVGSAVLTGIAEAQ